MLSLRRNSMVKAFGFCLLLLTFALALTITVHSEQVEEKTLTPTHRYILPKCRRFFCHNRCRYGYWTDQCGCQKHCKCRPRPCKKLLCRKYCKYGFKRNAYGCPICVCLRGKCRSSLTLPH